LCRETGSESESDGSGKRVEGEKGGSPVQLSATDESAANTPCSILLQQGTTTVSVEIEGMSRSLIIDTASNVPILKPAVSGRGVKISQKIPHSLTREALDVKDLQKVIFLLNRREYTHTFLVCSLPTEAAGLLGTDFLEKFGAVIDFEKWKISLVDMVRAPQEYSIV